MAPKQGQFGTEIKEAAASVPGSTPTVLAKTADVARAAVGSVKDGSGKAHGSTVFFADELLAPTQGPLASALSERPE